MNLPGNLNLILLPLAILLGLIVGLAFPDQGNFISRGIDPLVILLLGLLFLEARFEPLRKMKNHLRFLSIAWVANFVLIPFIAWGIAALFFGNQPALYTGLLLYFLFPCTDWFLGFTRIAKGDVALGTVLLPVNLVTQLLLFPVFLAVFIGAQTGTSSGAEIWEVLFQWFLIPLLAAVGLRLLLGVILPSGKFEKVSRFAGSAVSWVIAALVFSIFADHAQTLAEHKMAFVKILGAVFLFFVITAFLGEWLSRRFKLERPQHVLLAMTTAARNAPLILGLTTLALPDQPLVYAALIIGMLVEFPHLTFLSRFLQRGESSSASSRSFPQGASPSS
jgi:ACR3 family arsenite efflux pump ArsB